MIDEEDIPFAGPEPKSAAGVLSALKKAEREFETWQAVCQTIDQVYGMEGTYGGIRSDIDGYGWSDAKLDMFWASMEIIKPAVYAKPPVPAVAPMFKDNKPLQTTTSELLERASISVFALTGIYEVMCEVRDDVIFSGRGVMWLRYENDDGQRVCIEHKDRRDFIHEPARKWVEVGWVAGGAWMTRKEMRKRFRKSSGDAYQGAKFMLRRDDEHSPDSQTTTRKALVWEVWHKADNKVYWVSEGCDVLLDSGEPHLKLSGFFPCPRPAYATLRRRSLVPVPDWERYAIHFRKISDLTGRIYLLLDQVRLMGIVGGGGDIADALEEMWRSGDDDILVRVNTIGNVADQVSWLPLKEVAEAITGLIAARSQLIDDFYQLSGISDIMRGATEAEETLGAQQLKSQYGSVRVRGKIDELQRVAADAVKIAAEIVAEKFSKETLLEMAQMEIPTKADIEKRITEIEKAAKAELDKLGQKATEAAQQAQQGQGEPPDQAQAQQALQAAQQAIFDKYAPMLQEAEAQVPIEDVMGLLRDDRARSFTFEIETDSTILTDEMQEKQTRGEFLTAFSTASQSLMGLAAMGEPGAQLAGEMLKFALAPFRAGRQLDGAINAFLDAAPQMAAAAQGQQGESDALAEANNKLAEAEMVKAKAAMAGVEAKAALDKAELQRRMLEMQQKGAIEADKHQREAEKLDQQLRDMAGRESLMQAQVDHLTAQTAKLLHSIGLDERKQQVDEYQAAEQSQQQRVDTALKVEGHQSDQEYRERDAQRAERGEDRADRQQDFTETQTGDG